MIFATKLNRVMKIKILIVLIILLTKNMQAQVVTWTKFYDYLNMSDYGIQGIQTLDQGYAFLSISSYNDNTFPKNILITKVDHLGAIEFQKLISDSTGFGLWPGGFVQTEDSGFTIAGRGSSTAFLIKTDKYGSQQWRKDYIRPGMPTTFQTIQITSDKGYICAGQTYNPQREYILKSDSLGNKQWDTIYAGFRAEDIIQAKSGSYYVVNGNIFRKLNSNGGITWEIDTNVAALDILQHPNGYLYALQGNLLSKYDSSGNFYWQKDYYDLFPHSAYFLNFCIDSKNNIVLGGYVSYPFTTYPDAILARVDTGGNVLNYNIITTGKKDDDYIESVVPTLDNGFICAGSTSFEASSLFWNILAIKTDSVFNTTPIVNINGSFIFVPSHFQLYQNYPNPFNSSTEFHYDIGKFSFVTLKIFDISGKEISVLVNENKNSGNYKLNFTNNFLSSGIYFYSLYINSKLINTKKMVILK